MRGRNRGGRWAGGIEGDALMEVIGVVGGNAVYGAAQSRRPGNALRSERVSARIGLVLASDGLNERELAVVRGGWFD